LRKPDLENQAVNVDYDPVGKPAFASFDLGVLNPDPG
jgi:hypothetical protein